MSVLCPAIGDVVVVCVVLSVARYVFCDYSIRCVEMPRYR